jgi:hypothetical protein
MLERAPAVQLLADTLERLGAPFGLPEDWILLSDDDDLRFMRRPAAKKLLAEAKKETVRRWLHERLDPSEMDLELCEECEGSDHTVEFDDTSLKQRAIDSIDDVVSTVKSLREAYDHIAHSNTPSAAHEATVAARVAFGYPKERPDRPDCFGEDVRRQCRRVINEIYRRTDKSSGPVAYVIGVGDPNFVKIGFTTCFEQRLRSLRTASHVEPVVHLVISGSRSLERELHVRFKSARHNREWFRLTDEVAAFIASERAKAKVYAGRSASLAQVLEFRHTGSDEWSE